jgi:hypothetical protein
MMPITLSARAASSAFLRAFVAQPLRKSRVARLASNSADGKERAPPDERVTPSRPPSAPRCAAAAAAAEHE